MSRIGFAIVTFLLMSCASLKKINETNIPFLHDYPGLNPRYRIWNFSHDSTRLYVKIGSEELSYKVQNDSVPVAALQLQYYLHDGLSSRLPVDSHSIEKIILKNNSETIFFAVDFKSQLLKKYLLEIILTDLNDNKSSKQLLNVDRSSINSRQNFMAFTLPDSLPVFENHIEKQQPFFIQHFKRPVERLYVKYFSRRFEPAPPPFFFLKNKPFSFRADSFFSVSMNDTLRFSATGIYHFQADTIGRDGFTLFCFHEDFPKVTTPDLLTESLRYIAKNSEYEHLQKAQDKKLAADDFWLQRGGDTERAKVLIKEFYNRIQFANEHFTSYKEGWQTDRGLIYVIYGKPDALTKKDGKEIWFYNPTATEKGVGFTFIRTENVFSDNHYILRRSPEYEDSWNIATHKWRHGRVN